MQGCLCCADHIANIICADRQGVYNNHGSITWYMQKKLLSTEPAVGPSAGSIFLSANNLGAERVSSRKMQNTDKRSSK